MWGLAYTPAGLPIRIRGLWRPFGDGWNQTRLTPEPPAPAISIDQFTSVNPNEGSCYTPHARAEPYRAKRARAMRRYNLDRIRRATEGPDRWTLSRAGLGV